MESSRALTARTEDDVLLLAERYRAELDDLQGRILQQRAVLRDIGDAQRWRARRMLRRLENLADGYRRGLRRLGLGLPRCNDCDAPLDVALLLAHPQAATCRTCPDG